MGRKIVIDTYALFFDAELWLAVGDRGVLFYERLWGLAEQWGGFDPIATNLGLQMGAMGCSEQESMSHMDKLHAERKIVYYEVNGKQIGFIGEYMTHNKHQHASPPILKLPPWVTYDKTKKKYSINDEGYSKFLEGYGNVL